ncbi:hypothetical protein SKAU_G00195250 [Synaphobranchus kaupii]|uniref:Uncharacterized protein n=1 Tax=Synaphobranchus kaupii TaxID=118154 RepID=A0A9Q1FEA8_SYNKA|nr:hypothetical protein SKAU_G00195250 [Synaphobranchus kaupii]
MLTVGMLLQHNPPSGSCSLLSPKAAAGSAPPNTILSLHIQAAAPTETPLASPAAKAAVTGSEEETPSSHGPRPFSAKPRYNPNQN